MTTAITKVTSHISHNEQLIFERSQTGRIGYRLPALDVDEVELNILLSSVATTISKACRK